MFYTDELALFSTKNQPILPRRVQVIDKRTHTRTHTFASVNSSNNDVINTVARPRV